MEATDPANLPIKDVALEQQQKPLNAILWPKDIPNDQTHNSCNPKINKSLETRTKYPFFAKGIKMNQSKYCFHMHTPPNKTCTHFKYCHSEPPNNQNTM
eukprot:4965330-Amphidinium_carterae.1